MARYIAFHLPQYHSFPENEEWWGRGFTDWVNVKRAKPLFPGHCQPKAPLGGFYYDMTSPATGKWQAELAKKYGLYGFCYYHYYFNGKLLMEKPLELMLREKEIAFPFCLCWANEPWTRAWDGKTSTVLMPQSYGDISDWERHFDYLLPFFQDSRYICVENKPVFVIYRTNNIPDCDEMISYFDTQCKKNGFSGIYLCEELNTFQGEPVCTNSSAVIAFEPANVQRDRSRLKKALTLLQGKLIAGDIKKELKIFDYRRIWGRIQHQTYRTRGKKLFYGAFTAWDNTPRKGSSGAVYLNASPEEFEKNLRIVNQKADDEGSEFIFINAWNEWAEGAYLEPDEKNGYAFLEAVRASKAPDGYEDKDAHE